VPNSTARTCGTPMPGVPFCPSQTLRMLTSKVPPSWVATCGRPDCQGPSSIAQT
jgi:hypothetical protein